MDKFHGISKQQAGKIFDNIPILAGIDGAAKSLLLSNFHIEEFLEESIVIRQGDAGDKLYAILEGEVVVKRKTESGLWHDIVHLYKGDVFGEVAILKQMERTATIITLRPSVFLTLYANV